MRLGLTEEDMQVIFLAQALDGAVSPNFRRVTLELTGPRAMCIRFLLEQDNPDDREEIGDIVFEFEAMQKGFIDEEIEIICDARSVHELNLPGRVVYGRKERRSG